MGIWISSSPGSIWVTSVIVFFTRSTTAAFKATISGGIFIHRGVKLLEKKRPNEITAGL